MLTAAMLAGSAGFAAEPSKQTPPQPIPADLPELGPLPLIQSEPEVPSEGGETSQHEHREPNPFEAPSEPTRTAVRPAATTQSVEDPSFITEVVDMPAEEPVAAGEPAEEVTNLEPRMDARQKARQIIFERAAREARERTARLESRRRGGRSMLRPYAGFPQIAMPPHEAGPYTGHIGHATRR